MRLHGALRLSRGKANSTSLERQREMLEMWAGRNGHEIVSWSEDEDVSGATCYLERPDLARYLPLPAGTDGVAGIRVERLSRDTADWLAFTADLKGRGKHVFATEEAIHVGPGVDAAGTGHSSMLAVFATMERDRMREKAAESRQKLASLGRFAGGKPPFGYLSICLCHGAVACPHAGTKLCAGWVLAQDPVRAGYAEKMANRAIDGHSNGKIARWLNAEGIKTQHGKAWRPETVNKVLRGHALAGYAVRAVRVGGHMVSKRVRDADGADVMITADPILADERWRLLQAALDSRGQHRAPRRLGAHQLLRVAYCGVCSVRPRKGTAGKLVPMYGHHDQGRTGRDIYRCQVCGQSRPKAEVEARLEGILLEALGGKPLPRRVEIPAVSHTAELAELDAKITDLDEQFAEGNVPASAYGRMMTRLGARRDELAALPQREAEVRYEHDDNSPTVRDHWASLTPEDRGAFLRHWGVQIFTQRSASGQVRYVMAAGWESPDGTGDISRGWPNMVEAFGLTSADVPS